MTGDWETGSNEKVPSSECFKPRAWLCNTHSLGRAWTGSPYSRRLRWNRRCSPSTSWRSSWRWSARCCPPRTRSRSRWAWWSRPGSSRSRRPRSSRSPCTSPPSCSSWWRRQKDRAKNPSSGAAANSSLPPGGLQGDRNSEQKHAGLRGWQDGVCVHHHLFCLEGGFVSVKVNAFVAPAWFSLFCPSLGRPDPGNDIRRKECPWMETSDRWSLCETPSGWLKLSLLPVISHFIYTDGSHATYLWNLLSQCFFFLLPSFLWDRLV